MRSDPSLAGGEGEGADSRSIEGGGVTIVFEEVEPEVVPFGNWGGGILSLHGIRLRVGINSSDGTRLHVVVIVGAVTLVEEDAILGGDWG